MKCSSVFSIATVVSAVSAHSIFSQVTYAGTTYPVSYAIRDPTYDGPITDVTSNDIACNGGPNPTTASPYVIDVKAGSTIQAIWRHTLTSTSSDVIDSSHKGPVIAYLKKVTNSVSDVGYGTGWFKIGESGLVNPSSSPQVWAVDNLIAAGGAQDITIPACIASGQYLLRAEIIALHGASSSGGAQFYMECAQLNITGGTGAKTPSTVSFPGTYKATDPGILVNIYYPVLTNYTIPGPTKFTC